MFMDNWANLNSASQLLSLGKEKTISLKKRIYISGLF